MAPRNSMAFVQGVAFLRVVCCVQDSAEKKGKLAVGTARASIGTAVVTPRFAVGTAILSIDTPVEPKLVVGAARPSLDSAEKKGINCNRYRESVY